MTYVQLTPPYKLHRELSAVIAVTLCRQVPQTRLACGAQWKGHAHKKTQKNGQSISGNCVSPGEEWAGIAVQSRNVRARFAGR